MAGRLTGAHARSGDANASPEQRDVAKKLLGHMDGQRKLGGPTTASMLRTLADGSVVVATLVDGQPRAQFLPGDARKGAPQEDVIYCYIASPGGLRVFDLAAKKLIKTVTGVETFTVDGTNRRGNVVYMSQQGASAYQAARIDLGKMTATGSTFRVNVLVGSNVVLGYAVGLQGALSPDGKLELLHFDFGADEGGAVKDGVGGWLLINPDTFAPLRPAIRMTHEPQAFAWRGDSKRFYLSTSVATDGEVSAARFTAITESHFDYVAVFDAAGTLLGSRELVEWGYEYSLDSGFRRPVTALCAGGHWLAALVERPSPQLVLMDARDDALPIVGTIAVGGDPLPNSLAFNADGSRLTVIDGTRVQEFGVSNGGTLTAVHDAASTTVNVPVQIRTVQAVPVLNLPRGRTPVPPSRWQFCLSSKTDSKKLLQAYSSGFENAPVYEYALNSLALNHRYALASVGTRPTRKAA